MNVNPPTPNQVRHRTALLAAVGGALLLLAACGSGGSSSGAAAPTVSASAGTVGVAKTALGSVLTDGDGKTLYLLTADSAGTSNCSGACVAAWPVVAPLTGHAADVTATLASLTRDDGTKQLTVDGMPAYTYAADQSAGSTNGQGIASFGGTWWVLGSDGKPVTTMPSAPMGGGGY